MRVSLSVLTMGPRAKECCRAAFYAAEWGVARSAVHSDQSHTLSLSVLSDGPAVPSADG